MAIPSPPPLAPFALCLVSTPGAYQSTLFEHFIEYSLLFSIAHSNLRISLWRRAGTRQNWNYQTGQSGSREEHLHLDQHVFDFPMPCLLIRKIRNRIGWDQANRVDERVFQFPICRFCSMVPESHALGNWPSELLSPLFQFVSGSVIAITFR
jgi:hypothetical protein